MHCATIVFMHCQQAFLSGVKFSFFNSACTSSNLFNYSQFYLNFFSSSAFTVLIYQQQFYLTQKSFKHQKFLFLKLMGGRVVVSMQFVITFSTQPQYVCSFSQLLLPKFSFINSNFTSSMVFKFAHFSLKFFSYYEIIVVYFVLCKQSSFVYSLLRQSSEPQKTGKTFGSCVFIEMHSATILCMQAQYLSLLANNLFFCRASWTSSRLLKD